jgi:antirestriction protein ArdC
MSLAVRRMEAMSSHASEEALCELGHDHDLVNQVLEVTAEDDGETERGKRLMARASYVFNADQVDRFEAPPLPETKDPAQILDKAEAFITATGADIHHGGNRTFYHFPQSGGGDFIQMPGRERFMGTETSTATESYYGTLLHELTHYAVRRIMPCR